MVGLKVSTLGPQIGAKIVFSPLKFLRAMYEHPIYDIINFTTYRVVWQLCENWLRMSKNPFLEKDKKIVQCRTT